MFVSLQDHDIPAIQSAIKEHAQLSCSCSLVNASFTESSQSCSNNNLTFSTTFIYAASNGLLIASEIVEQLERTKETMTMLIRNKCLLDLKIL